MKRYIKSSFSIEFHFVTKYSSYEDYCYAEMQGYYNEELTDDDYEDEISDFNSNFIHKFGNLNKLESVISAYIGFVPFSFVLVNDTLYQLGYDKGITFTEVTEDWLKQLGCKTSLDEIYMMLK